MSAAHRFASASVFVGKWSRCGKIEKSTTPRVRSSCAAAHSTKDVPILGVMTMLPALTPTQTVSDSIPMMITPSAGVPSVHVESGKKR